MKSDDGYWKRFQLLETGQWSSSKPNEERRPSSQAFACPELSRMKLLQIIQAIRDPVSSWIHRLIGMILRADMFHLSEEFPHIDAHASGCVE